MYSGHIYNNEGIPLSGIPVSDGLNITVSDEQGAYSLPGWERARVISVQALTVHHDDWYRMIDKEIDVYDFYVTPYKCGEDCSFFHFSDTEIFLDNAYPERWVGGIKELVDEHKPDFIVHTGDICRRKGLEGHRYAMNSDNMGVPVRYTLGNHDYVNDKYGEYTFERLYGPVWYSFDLGKVHFIVLPITYGDAPSGYEKDDHLNWLKNDLEAMAADLRPVVLCHSPLGRFENECTIKGEAISIDLSEYDALAWVFGHLHVGYIREGNGRFHIGTGRPDFGGIDGSPAGCRLIRVGKGHKLTTKILYNKKTSNVCEVERRVVAKNFCFTSPICAEGKIFVSSIDNGYPCEPSIMALNANGDVAWKYRMTASVRWNMAYEDGMVYAKDGIGIIYALSAKDGSLIWKKQLTEENVTESMGGLRIQNGEIFVASNKRAFILDVKSGEIKLASEYNELPATTTVPPVPFGNKVIWGKHWRGLICFDRESGKTLWQNKDTMDFLTEPITVGNVIYAPTRYRIAKLDENGNILAESEMKSEKFFNIAATPIYYKGKLFVPTSECGLGIYDAENLELIKYIGTEPSLIAVGSYNPIGEQTVLGKPIIAGDTLIFAAADGNVYFCDVESYEVKRKVSIGHPIISSIASTDEGYYVCDFDGGLSFIRK